jgi:hypothetical protein
MQARYRFCEPGRGRSAWLNEHADLVCATIRHFFFLPYRSSVGNHCRAFESPTSVMVRRASLSPYTHPFGVVLLWSRWQPLR